MKEFYCVGSSKMTQHELNLQSKCAQCGKTFLHTGDHVYKDKSGGRQRMYCCYTCFRVRAREAEKKAREKFERAATSDQRRAQQLRDQKFRRRERKNWGYKCGKNWEYVIFESEDAAREYAAHAQKKIEQYEKSYRESEPGTSEREAAQRNLSRWKRVKNNIKVEGKTECTSVDS